MNRQKPKMNGKNKGEKRPRIHEKHTSNRPKIMLKKLRDVLETIKKDNMSVQ